MGLKIGTHDYFGETINTVPIRTTSALCYKVEPLKFEFTTSLLFQILIFDKVNSVDKVNLYVAANNTWQSLIYGVLPRHAKSPLKIVGEISQNSKLNQYNAQLEIAEWSYMEGNKSNCLRDNEMTGLGCNSMFHPDSYKFENRYVLIINQSQFLIYIFILFAANYVKIYKSIMM